MSNDQQKNVYMTGGVISTSTVEFTTPKGANVAVILYRNAEPATNGWVWRAEKHTLSVYVNGSYHGAPRAIEDELLCMHIGNTKIGLPPSAIAGVQSLLDAKSASTRICVANVIADATEEASREKMFAH